MMARTRGRPSVTGDVNVFETLVFCCLAGGFGLSILYFLDQSLNYVVNSATFVGYAIIYTVVLKP